MRVMLSCRALEKMAGGVERMILALAGAMLERGHSVSLLTWDKEVDAKPFYEMDPRITWHKLAAGDPAIKAGWHARLKRALKVRRIVASDKPDVIMAFQEGAFIALRFYLLGRRLPIICAERNAPQRFDYLPSGRWRYWYYRAMIFAHVITVQLPSYIKLYPWYLRQKIRVIPNPVFPAMTCATPATAQNGLKTLLCIARLDYQKNQLVLVDAFALLANRFPDWRLVLAGEGNERKQLEEKIAHYNLTSRILLLGAFKDVASLYVNSHLFCLPSRWEGFPNNLVEAFAHGLPAVGFADCAGINDLIIPQSSGLLASGMNDPTTLADSLAILMADDDARARMGDSARRQVEAYQPERIFDAWEELFKKLAHR